MSISCLVYNHEPFLRQCLDGFVMQKTTFPFEAVVHDDASTDGSAAIIREYAEKYPDIIKPIYETENQYHKGTIWKIMNAAMHPNSKYIALCEGDDYWTDPNKLQIQVDFLESHPDYTLCFHRAKTILNETEEETNRFPSETFKTIQDRDYTSTELMQVWTVPTASMVYLKKCQSFPLNFYYIVLYGDIVKVLSCAEMGKVRGFDRTMSVYRIHSGGVTISSENKRKYIMCSPGHYLFIKDNFPKVDKKILHGLISYRYWIRAPYQSKMKQKIRDYWKSFQFDFIGSSKRLMIQAFPKLYSSYQSLYRQ